MTNDDNPSDSVFIAMQAFSSIAEATEFTANEVALFYALLQSWNSARRPAVVEQWAKTTSWKSGIKDQKALVRARNTLIQKGVIFYEKRGNRCMPRYSLNALFGRKPPDGLLVNTASKSACKVTVSSPVKSHSYLWIFSRRT